MTVWGPAVCDSTNCFRIGYDVSQSPATVTNGTTSVTITLTIKLQTQYYANDSGASWSISGDIAASGSTAFNHGSSTSWSSANITTLATRTKVVTPSFSGTVVTNGAASVSGLVAIAGTASVNWSITTAQRPVGVPATPTGVISSRTSDTQQNVAWTNTNPTSASNPYTNVIVQRSTDGGAWTSIATLGVVTSYSDKTTSADHHYQYRVQAKNGAGYSAVSASTATLWTTPRAPSTPVASKTSGGDITITWANPSTQASATEVWHAANGVWDGAALTTALAGNAVTYTHVAPNAAQTHTYRVRYKVSNPALTGPYSADSNVVQLQAPPAAPTTLAPAGVAVDGTEAQTLTWRHNPVDTTAQSKYEVQYRVNGGAWVSSGTITSSASSRVIAANTWTNGTTVEWQVRTYGAHATASPWSATATLNVVARPVVAITNPGATFNASTLTAAWTYFDAQATAEASWEATLTDSAGVAIETRSGASSDTSVTFTSRIEDATGYRVRVRAQNGYGLFSLTQEQAFTVAYALPEVPLISLLWNSLDESVSINIDNPPTTGGHVDTISNDVWRSIDGGPWLLVARGVPNDGTIVDPIPSLSGVNLYRVFAISATPSTVSSDYGFRAELLSNTGFETDASGWTANSGTIASAALAQSVEGQSSLEYTSTASSAGNAYVQSVAAPAVVGKTYAASAYVRAPAGSPITQFALQLRWLTAGGVQVSLSAATTLTVTAGDEMRLITASATAPATATQVQARLYVPTIGLAVGQKFHVDLASLKEVVQQNSLPAISTPGSPAAVINAGQGFGKVAKLLLDVRANITRSRAKVLQVFEGRTLPVEYTGQQRSRVVSVNGKITSQYDTTAWAQFEALSDEPAPACYRDPDGRRIFVSLGEVQGSDFGGRTQSVSWPLTEVDWREEVLS